MERIKNKSNKQTSTKTNNNLSLQNKNKQTKTKNKTKTNKKNAFLSTNLKPNFSFSMLKNTRAVKSEYLNV